MCIEEKLNMNNSDYFSNSTNLTSYELCKLEHDISSFNELVRCYFYLFQFSIAESILGLVILFGSCIANVLVIILITVTHKKITFFDQILIGHGKFFNFLPI